MGNVSQLIKLKNFEYHEINKIYKKILDILEFNQLRKKQYLMIFGLLVQKSFYKEMNYPIFHIDKLENLK